MASESHLHIYFIWFQNGWSIYSFDFICIHAHPEISHRYLKIRLCLSGKYPMRRSLGFVVRPLGVLQTPPYKVCVINVGNTHVISPSLHTSPLTHQTDLKCSTSHQRCWPLLAKAMGWWIYFSPRCLLRPYFWVETPGACWATTQIKQTTNLCWLIKFPWNLSEIHRFTKFKSS